MAKIMRIVDPYLYEEFIAYVRNKPLPKEEFNEKSNSNVVVIQPSSDRSNDESYTAVSHEVAKETSGDDYGTKEKNTNNETKENQVEQNGGNTINFTPAPTATAVKHWLGLEELKYNGQLKPALKGRMRKKKTHVRARLSASRPVSLVTRSRKEVKRKAARPRRPKQ